MIGLWLILAWADPGELGPKPDGDLPSFEEVPVPYEPPKWLAEAAPRWATRCDVSATVHLTVIARRDGTVVEALADEETKAAQCVAREAARERFEDVDDRFVLARVAVER